MTWVPVPAALAAAAVRVEPGVTYGEHDGQALRLDVYLPPAPGRDRAAALLIHGGGWSQGDKSDERAVGETMAQSGWVAFAIGYTLDSPSRPGYPLQVEECQAALRWVEQHAHRFHIDVHRLVVYGGSAGGYLAAMVATLGPGRPGYAPVAAAVSLSAPLDPALLVQEYRAGAPCRPTGCAVTYTALNHLSWFLGCPLRRCAAALLSAASPVDHVTNRTPPFFLYNSADEVIPASQATAMEAALRREGVPVQLMVLPGESHGPPSLLDVKLPITSFLAAHVPPAPPPGHVWRWVVAGAATLAVVTALLVLGLRRRRQPNALL